MEPMSPTRVLSMGSNLQKDSKITSKNHDYVSVVFFSKNIFADHKTFKFLLFRFQFVPGKVNS